ncbi:hypothetical protein NQ317_006300 [Molorchus minor]|uniref:Uncharacterized protein n=1 Tax=Molorchus minor TaxID=1323400 RepID=A0ABQ9JJJ9_9CUCU|nr:hypothetical protein NQ317_006300 [Molorchus minor]
MMELLSENNTNVKTQVCPPPTYLKEFFCDENEIILGYDKRDSCISYEDEISEIRRVKSENNDSDSTLELTGDPLKVDLDGDETFEYIKSERPNQWTSQESRHFPLSLKKGKRIYKSTRPKAIYMVCDGSDPMCTVLIGAQQGDHTLLTCAINIIGCYPKDHEVISLESMEASHIKYTFAKNPKLYGSFLQSLKDLYHCEHYGSICIEVSSTNCSLQVPQTSPNMKMILKIIAGHNLSCVYFLWEELCCENLSALRDSLHYFFEELIESETNIINDYQAIIKNFCSASDQTINEKWSKFQNQELMSQGGVRKTRVTVNLRSGVLDLDNNISKLAYLGKLHLICRKKLSKIFCERVYKNYIDKDTAPNDFSELRTSPLCEFSINLNSADTNIVQKETPLILAMQMTSQFENLQVTTIYHLSEHPIFPTSIYNNYDVQKLAGDNKMIYYVSKMVKYKEFI